ncbi:hypothetical protein MNBD_NITROSPIRAE03-720 [hydrothermal vent metagenome]|uniref:Uncharacterized protein n=1 Tax=hydrothermal vent metagenome TaxID=652676 RepID=A0A3B1CIE3_9ZZZZ
MLLLPSLLLKLHYPNIVIRACLVLLLLSFIKVLCKMADIKNKGEVFSVVDTGR